MALEAVEPVGVEGEHFGTVLQPFARVGGYLELPARLTTHVYMP